MGLIQQKRTAVFAQDIITRFDVRTTGPRALAKSLSGGNLQKFLVGREVLQDPSVLVINQPTWGVDAGAALAIHEAVMALAQAGRGGGDHLAGPGRVVRPGGPHRRTGGGPHVRPGADAGCDGRKHRAADGWDGAWLRLGTLRLGTLRLGMLRLQPRGAESAFWRFASPVLALALTCVVSGLLFAAMGRPPLLTIYTFLVAPLLQQDGLVYLVVKAAPLITIAVGLSLAYRANIWNIGTEGQFTLGAIAAGGVALAFPETPGLLIFPALMIAGLVGGMAGGGLVAWLRIRFNANEILTSLMLTYIVQYLLLYLVTGPWRDPMGFGFPQTALFSDAADGPRLIEDSNVHLGVLLAPLIAVALWVMLAKTVVGYQFRVLGQAPRALRFAGFSESRLVWVAMLISGGLAGLAGMFEVTGTLGQLNTNLSPGYGFAAIIVAFLGRLNPLGIIPAGLLLALSYLGGDAAQINLGLPNAVTAIFQGILLFCLLGCDVLLLHRVRWRRAVAA